MHWVTIVQRRLILVISARLVNLVIIRPGCWSVSSSGSAKRKHNLDRVPR